MSAWNEKPPILSGNTRDDLSRLRDYLFRMAGSLSEATQAPAVQRTAIVSSQGKSAASGGSSAKDIEAIRKQADELKSLIIKSAENLGAQIEEGDAAVIAYADSKTEEYNSLYVAKSEFGEYKEAANVTIQNTAKGVVESYKYGEQIQSVQDGLSLYQQYINSIDGEIRRGIVLDPSTGHYVTGVAISQNLQFSGVCGPSDPENPGDGYTYYYLNEGQTFGLYTATGWQFWIDGVKVGWFNSLDGMLHVSSVYVESRLQIGARWVWETDGTVLRLRPNI